MHQRKVFAYVVGGLLERALMKQLSPGEHVHAAILHSARIAAARAVHGNAVAHQLGNGIVVHLGAWCPRNGAQDVHLARVVAECLHGLLLGRKAFIARTGKPLHARLALRPRVAHPGLGATPHHIPLSAIVFHFNHKITNLWPPHQENAPTRNAQSLFCFQKNTIFADSWKQNAPPPVMTLHGAARVKTHPTNIIVSCYPQMPRWHRGAHSASSLGRCEAAWRSATTA